jgi:NADH:ubiquinone oxidoreductase subunit
MLATTLLTWFKGKQVGVDNQGNTYYEEKFWFKTPKDRMPRRWVIYKGIPEGSKAAPEWHGWLHYTTQKTPSKEQHKPHKWEKGHLPNLTGTKQAYRPPANRKAKPYQAWSPENRME